MMPRSGVGGRTACRPCPVWYSGVGCGLTLAAIPDGAFLIGKKMGGLCWRGLQRQVTPEPPAMAPLSMLVDRSPRVWADRSSFMAAYQDALDKCASTGSPPTPRAVWTRMRSPTFGIEGTPIPEETAAYWQP